MTPKTVAEIVCAFNYYQGEHPEDKYSWGRQNPRNRRRGILGRIRVEYALSKIRITLFYAVHHPKGVILSNSSF